MRYLGLLFFAAAPAVFAQLDSDTLSITASRRIDAAIDSLEILVTATAPATMPFEAVVEALRPAGVTAASLVDAYASLPLRVLGEPAGERTDWTFRVPTTFANLAKAVAPLVGFRNQGIELYYYVQPAYPGASCPLQTLLADAQSQAQKLASAAAVRLGPVVSISDKDEWKLPQRQAIFLVSAFLSVFPAIPPADKCSLTVRFKLLRN